MRNALPTRNEVRRLFYKERRKTSVIPEHAVLTPDLVRKISNKREKIRNAPPKAQPELEKELSALLRKKRRQEDLYIDNAVLALHRYIVNQPNTVRLQTRDVNGSKLFRLNKGRTSHKLFDRYCADRLREIYSLRSPGRDQIIRVLIGALAAAEGKGQGSASRAIIRFDIENFYGSIPHELLLKKIERNTGVPRYIVKHVRAVVTAYERVLKVGRGIPRGISSSATLAEIYLEDLDYVMRTDSRIALYLRYVDDVVLICDAATVNEVLHLVESTLNDLQLRRNTSKCDVIVHPDKAQTSFQYLGYRFVFEKGNSRILAVDMSSSKSARYKAAAGRLIEYADKIECWAECESVDLYLAAIEYLLVPHYGVGGDESIRVVTGLAYTSRFLNGDVSGTQNFNELMNFVNRRLLRNLRDHLESFSPTFTCHHCIQPIYRLRDLQSMASTRMTRKLVMHSSAKEHVLDELREKVSKLLWN